MPRRPLIGWTRRFGSVIALAVVAYVPPFFSSPGVLAGDTKTYLYLNPGQFLSQATRMWDPSVAAGTVPHQNIGYLFPMGPYYWLTSELGIPTWIAQRIWWGSTFFAAGLGMLALFRLLDVERRDVSRVGAFVGALAFQLSPYVVPYVPRHSVLLGAWAALPWFIVLAARSIREGGWRWPAAFAIVLLLVGSINASSLLFAALGPALWAIYDAGVIKTVRWRAMFAALARIGVLSLAVSLWWIVGLAIQGRYGVDVLRYTETPRTVAGTSTAVETLRQLGYWFFYGKELYFPFTPQASGYMTHLWLITAGFAVPTFALAGAALSRWRHRALFALLLLTGVVVSVGDHLWGPPSLWQMFWTRFSTTSSGLALRSTPRAVPLVALGLAGLLATGVTAMRRFRPPIYGAATGLAVVALIVNQQPLFGGHLIAEAQRQPEQVPTYWKQAAAALTSGGDSTRVLTLPGTDFAGYRWGYTLEPVLPGLTSRPSIQRESVPYGGFGTVDLLKAVDERLQEEVLDPAAIAPIARRLGVGDIVEQRDLAYERYPTPRPTRLAEYFAQVPGLGPPQTFGAPSVNQPKSGPLLDNYTLSDGAPTALAPLAIHPITKPLPIVRAEAGPAVVVAGNGDGVVDVAALGLLDRSGPLLYSGSLSTQQLQKQLADGADLVLTDSNRDAPLGWGGVRDNNGATRVEGQKALSVDTLDSPMSLFSDPTTRSYAVVSGVASVQATHEGQPLIYTPEDRAANAIDGDPLTDWRVTRFTKPIGERLNVNLKNPVTTDHVSLLQTITIPRSPINQVRLWFDRANPVDANLGDASHAEPGQTIQFPARTFSSLSVEIRNTTLPGFVGLAEITIPGVHAEQFIQLPTDLLTKAGSSAQSHRLFVVMSRARSNASDETRRDQERAIDRLFTLPDARSFSVVPQVHLASNATDATVDQTLGYADASAGGVTVTTSGRLNGCLACRGRAAIDDDGTSAWVTPFYGPTPWIRVQTSHSLPIDHLDLQLVADGHHSVPTNITLAGGGSTRTLTIPPVPDNPNHPNATVTLRFAPIVASDITITVTATRALTTVPNGLSEPVALPIAIAELGIPGLPAASAPKTLPGRCLPDLVSVDDHPVAFAIKGTVTDAMAGHDLEATPCSTSAITIGAGQHALRTKPGEVYGFDVDRVALASDAGGSALALGDHGAIGETAPAITPLVEVVHDQRTSLDLKVTGATAPFWLVLGQSRNAGWVAHVTGGKIVGGGQLVDGYANGWYIEPTSTSLSVSLTWQPQRAVWIALGISGLASLLCLALVLRRRKPRPAPARPAELAAFPSRLDATSIAAVAVGAFVLIPPYAAFALVIAVVLGDRIPRPFTRWAPAVLAMLVGGAVVAGQLVRHPADGYGWPALFDPIDGLVWLAVALLAVSTVRQSRGGSAHFSERLDQ